MNKIITRTINWLLLLTLLSSTAFAQSGIVVFQSDFGVKDGAVSEVKGIIYSVDRSLILSDLTHEIPAYNIWEASYRLYQTAAYWPKQTVFLSVVDPGVGTSRHSVVALTKNGQYFVTPDNGTLTLIDKTYGIQETRIIDETKNRLQGSSDSHTFYGRDVFGYTAAKLASGKISFAEVGPVLKKPLVKLSYQEAIIKNNALYGTIVTHDPQYGNVWTNIDKNSVEAFGLKINKPYRVSIYHKKSRLYSAELSLHHTFGEVKKGSDLLYLNSLLHLALATTQDSFAQKHHIGSGPEWTIKIEKI